ncbi:mannose-P-dolichol utilization defect 1 protein homolog [Amphibalanus amphitrite]|uniref:mannose-P-dolichol utilization defect 1 protein homolog n=1 Tax=Amphibalanus amphitrite TaxID=1232801 RepID=UPI001C929E23|nr:mannose-P-dolichol utilization defect 1 protein homolog [Amphibalanus amphitrite]
MDQAKEVFEKLALLVTTPDCYDEFFNKMNFMHVPCLKSTLSKGLGLGIVAGSSLVKVPQVLKILMNKSAEGISIYGVLMELFAVTAATAYCFVQQYPFSAYGEGVFLILQTALIAALVLLFSGQRVLTFLFCALYPAALYYLVAGFAPMDVLWALQSANVPIIVAAKLIQVVTNYRAGSTGQLSAITVMLLFLGSLARIFTSVQETGDTTLIVTFIATSFVNGLLAAQVVYYWNAQPAGAKPAAGKNAAKKKAGKKAKKTD